MDEVLQRLLGIVAAPVAGFHPDSTYRSMGGVGKHGLSGADSVTTTGSDNGEEKKTFKQQPSGGSKGLHAAAPNTQIQSKQTCWACDMAQRRKG